MNSKTLASILLILAAIAQIVAALFPLQIHWGMDLIARSKTITHPLMPYGAAFSLWGAIYLYALVASFKCLHMSIKQSAVFDKAVWPTLLMYGLNTLWSLWVPLHGFDLISVTMMIVSLCVGLVTLFELGPKARDKGQASWVVAPLALMGGWITVVSVLNISGLLVQSQAAFDPRQEWVSFIFLVGFIVLSAVLILLIKSRVYALPLFWALAWIVVANLVRAPSILLVNTGVGGFMGLLCIVLLARIYREQGLKGTAQATFE